MSEVLVRTSGSTRGVLDQIGRTLGIDQSSLQHDYLELYEEAFGRMARAPRSVLVVSAQPGPGLGAALATRFPAARVVVLGLNERSVQGRADLDNLVCMRVSGAAGVRLAAQEFDDIDVVVEDGHNLKSEKIAIFDALWLRVRPGGLYIVEDLHAVDLDALVDVAGDDILAKLFRLADSGRRVSGSLKGEEAEYAKAVSRLEVTGRLALVWKTGNHLLKTSEDEAASRARGRGRWWRYKVLEKRQSFESRASVECPRADLVRRFRSSFDLPQVELRSYRDVEVYPRQVVARDGLLLPETYRLFRKANLTNSQIASVSRDIARLDKAAPTRVLSGDYVYLDSEWLHVYGHTTTEVVSRLYVWRELLDSVGDVRVLVSSDPKLPAGEVGIRPWVREYMEAFGIPASRIEVIAEPVVVERLYSGTPLFSNYGYAHPSISATWDSLRERFTRGVDVQVPERIFVGRRAFRLRSCRNVDEVEARFVKAGYEVFYPEDFPLSIQAHYFANAREIAGFGGSAMLNAIFCSSPIDMTVIAPESYDAINEYLIASVVGGRVRYLYQDAEVKHPDGGWSSAAYHSPFVANVSDGPSSIDAVLKSS